MVPPIPPLQARRIRCCCRRHRCRCLWLRPLLLPGRGRGRGAAASADRSAQRQYGCGCASTSRGTAIQHRETPAAATLALDQNCPPADSEAGTNGDRIVIVMVGLPARGKTYIARKVARYLSFFHGAPTGARWLMLSAGGLGWYACACVRACVCVCTSGGMGHTRPEASRVPPCAACTRLRDARCRLQRRSTSGSTGGGSPGRRT